MAKNPQEEIKKFEDFYKLDDRPWVITLSGGKDSSTVLHLALSAYVNLKKRGEANKPVYIVTSDTRVEMPIVEDYVNETIEKLNEWINKNDYDVYTKIITPLANDTFWSKIIGRGYPSPTQSFRWCTDRMKIRPTTSYIESLVKKHGSVVMMLGVRKSESSNRKASIEKRELNYFNVSLHDSIKDAYVYSPIVDWSNEDVWTFLTSFNPDWGNNKKMMKLYDKGSSEADCNIAIHPSDSSCGKTRFGCWVCTVVNKDESMEGMFKNSDEKGLENLIALREKLKRYREPESGKRVNRKRNGVKGFGPYTIEARIEFLNDLFQAEKATGSTLIGDDELISIQNFWNMDGDLKNTAIKRAQAQGRLLNYQIRENKDMDCSDEFNFIYQLEKERKKNGNRYGIVEDLVNVINNITNKEENDFDK